MQVYSKAITGAILAFLGALSTALPGGVTGQEWITIAVATVVAGSGVWAVPNVRPPVAEDPSTGRHSRPSPS